MIVNDTLRLVQVEHYRDLLRDAEQERLLNAAFPRSGGQRRLRRLAAHALRGLAMAALHTSDALSPQFDQPTTFDAVGQAY
jgi:hypothetical protein